MKAGAKSEFVGQVANLRPIANRPPRFFLTVAAVVATISAALLTAQKTNSGPILSLTATTDNVAGAPAAIRIDLLRWSTDAERDQLSAAWAMTPRPAASGRGGAKGRAGAARSPAAADDDTSDPFGSFGRNHDKGGAAARGGRGSR